MTELVTRSAVRSEAAVTRSRRDNVKIKVPHSLGGDVARSTLHINADMSNLTVFEFDSQEIEIVVIDGNPWFNASQTAKALGYLNPLQALQDNVSVKYIQQIHLGRRGKKPNFISEPGLYQLIMRSKLPNAEQFQDWVFEEVLPTIRKTGVYAVEPQPPAPPLPPADRRVVELTQALQVLGVDIRNPRYNQSLQDYALDILGAKTLPGSAERWVGVVELAEEMGYSQAKELSHRSALGRYVSAKSNGKIDRVQEMRLCNGTQRLCWLYQDCDRLRELIKSYFVA